MHRIPLRSDKLTILERSVIVGFAFLLVMAGFCLFGMFLLAPWIVGAVVAIAAFAEIQYRRRRAAIRTSGIHGTAHFASDDEIFAAGFSGRSDGPILGKLPVRKRRPLDILLRIVRLPFREAGRVRGLLGRFVIKTKARDSSAMKDLVRLPTSDTYGHIACYLSTGVGKTFKVLIPNLFSCPENSVVFDGSGEAVRQTAEFRRALGHEIVVIDPHEYSGWRDCDRYNPLSLVRPGDPGCFDFATHLAHALVVEKPESRQDPFWHDGTILAVGFLLLAVMLRGGERHANLLTLGELIDATSFRELCESLMDHPDSGLRRRAQQLLSFKGKTLDSLLACLAAAVGWMDSPAFGDVLSGSTFSVENLFQPNKKMTIYVVIPGHRAVESQPFVRTLLTAILYAGFEAGPDIHRPPVRFYFDEIATLGKLDLLMTLYTQGRKFGMRSFNFFQSVAQVAEIVGSPDKIQTFRSQMGAELFKPRDLQTAKEFSEWIGQTTVQTTSTSTQEGSNWGSSNTEGVHPNRNRSRGGSDGSSTTVSETGVPLLRPEEILQLGPQEALVAAAGLPPVRLNILDASDVQQLGNPATHSAHQNQYQYWLRCHAIILLLLVPFFFILSVQLVEFGSAEWSRRNSPTVRRAPTHTGQVRRLPAGRGGW